MSVPDLSFVDIGRRLEIEAIDGGRSQSEITLDPNVSGISTGQEEEEPVLLRSVDDVQERDEEEKSVIQFSEYAQRAYSQRELVYPFAVVTSLNALEVVQGREKEAKVVADLARMVREGGNIAKTFEKRAFRTLWRLTGGWGVSVGAPRDTAGLGEEAAIKQFRGFLRDHESGKSWPTKYGKNGDRGEDGFIILGRNWGGPVVFFQCKNTEADIEKAGKEFLQVSAILEDWFGKRHNQVRQIIRVFALNTILTIDTKEQFFRNSGEHTGMHILDAVDIVCAERESEPSFKTESSCEVF